MEPRQDLNTEKAKALQAAARRSEKQCSAWARSSAWAKASDRRHRGRLRPARSAWTSRSASAACRAAAWSRSTARIVGKTTLTLQVIAEMQKLGGTCAFIDAEHALDIQYAQKLGVNLQELLISQPDTGEQALEIVDALVRSARSTWSSSTRSPR
jgi:recombination protein RecA